jgi:hypothetical protein
MFLQKSLGSIAIVLAFSAAGLTYQTSIDLRKDGRVLTGSRKDFFLTGVQSNTFRLSSDLRDKFRAATISAIVVPPGKTGQQYVIGVVPNDGTLPDDWVVSEDEFNILRSLAVNRKMAKAEAAYQSIRGALRMGASTQAKAEAEELKLTINETDSDAAAAHLYAGYLFQNLEKLNELPVLSNIVAAYRKNQIESLQPFIMLAIEKSKPGWAAPFVISGSNDVVGTEELGSSSLVERYVKPGSAVGFLTVWYGRSLIVVPEKPGVPFNPVTDKTLLGYLVNSNPDVNKAVMEKFANLQKIPGK